MSDLHLEDDNAVERETRLMTSSEIRTGNFGGDAVFLAGYNSNTLLTGPVAGIVGSGGGPLDPSSGAPAGNWGDGVRGVTNGDSGSGVAGVHYGAGAGTYGQSARADGVFGITPATGRSGVAGIHQGNGNGVYGRSAQGYAGYFDGNVHVTGNVSSRGADCAEDFDVESSEPMEPGTVVVAQETGKLERSRDPYDRKVVGVVSGAGDHVPGMIFDRTATDGHRVPVALLGKVYCKVDATRSPISVGDLLTTSATAGHAMKADDPVRSFGSVIGKALQPQTAGTGLIRILVALR